MVNKIVLYVTSFVFVIFLIASAVIITLNFRPLYYFDINYLKITEEYDMDKAEIKENYDALIYYLQPRFKGDLEFPSLPMSEEGRIHFVDVKNIFVFFNYLMYITLILSFIGIGYLIYQKNYLFLKYSAILLFALPIILVIPFLIDFNYVFTLFHRIAFTNDYWLFNPETDPIILLLPERFFMHNALLILLIITIESVFMVFLYRKLVTRYIKKHGAEV